MQVSHNDYVRNKVSQATEPPVASYTGDWASTMHIHEGFPGSSVGKESTCNAGDPGLISGSVRFTGKGIGYPF